MKTKLILNTLLALFLFSAACFAQSGTYDVRFVFVEDIYAPHPNPDPQINGFECVISTVHDLEVKAPTAGDAFNISDQNYRFSFNRAARANPQILTELTLSAAGSDPNGNFFAYNVHTLTGSADTVVSYNVELAFGAGYLVETEWVKVGRMSFDVVDPTECYDLIWHSHAPEDFPPTFIGEKFNNQLFEAEENTYANTDNCFSPACFFTPVELSYFKANSDNCDIQLTWGTEAEIDNDYFEILKSADGENYKTIATIPGAGNTESPRYYEYMDRSVDAIDNYYILRQVDFDGTYEDFGPEIIKSKCLNPNIKNGISGIYPNPTNGSMVSLNFYSTADYDQVQVELKDVLGRTVDQVAIELNEGVNLINYDPSKLANGAYFISVQGENWYTKPMKLIKSE